MQLPDRAPARAPRPEQLAGMQALAPRFGSFEVFAEWIIAKLPASAGLTRKRAIAMLRKAEQAGAIAVEDPPGGLRIYWHPQKMEALLRAQATTH